MQTIQTFQGITTYRPFTPAIVRATTSTPIRQASLKDLGYTLAQAKQLKAIIDEL